MNDIKMTNRSEIVYLGDELIVRNAFTVGTESYDIVVKYRGIQRLGINVPSDLAERIKGIWQQTNTLWPTRDVTTEFTWDKNRILVNKKKVCVKRGVNPMKQLHELIVGRFYLGIPSQPASILAQPAATTSIHVEPLPSTPIVSSPSISQLISPPIKPWDSGPKPKTSNSARDIPRPCTERRPTAAPQVMGPDIDLTDAAAEAAFETVLREQGWERVNFFNSLLEPLQAIKRGNVQKDNKAVQFLTAFAREIGKTDPDDCVYLAVNYFCQHAKAIVLEAGTSETQLLRVVSQQLNN